MGITELAVHFIFKEHKFQGFYQHRVKTVMCTENQLTCKINLRVLHLFNFDTRELIHI